MSRCTPKSKEFMCEIERVADSFYSTRNIKVYYDADPNPYLAKRDYVLEATVTNDWNKYDTQTLKEKMREVGATRIIGGIKHAIARDYLDIAFDIKESKMKELGIEYIKEEKRV